MAQDSSNSPTLLFSDLIDGPKSGLGDGLGEGAIVTIWGKNLGSSQGASKVYIKDSAGVSREAAYIYEWTNANIHAGHPADLYTYHRMQTITFSIPSASADGAGKIYVAVDGVNSNELDFYVRSTGTFRWVGNDCGSGMGTPANSGAGSWANPWATINYATKSSAATVGDIIYICTTTETPGLLTADIYKDGAANNMMGLIAYPGKAVIMGDEGNHNTVHHHWVISKLSAFSDGGGIQGIDFSRFVANEISDYTCSDGQAGAISAGGTTIDDLKIFGNYVHDYGCETTGSKQHVFYLSHRQSSQGLINPYEVGWNYLKDNQARGGIHNYDEAGCGGFLQYKPIRVHDNVIVNQVGASIAFVAGCYAGYKYVFNAEVYNNLVINGGVAQSDGDFQENTLVLKCGVGGGTDWWCFDGWVKIYNNTFYGYATADCSESTNECRFMRAENLETGNSTLPWYFKNNIIIDTNSKPYYMTVLWTNPAESSNNLWYNGGDGIPASPPSWDTSPLASDPLFVDAANGDFTPLPASPVCGAGDPSIGPDIGAIPCAVSLGPCQDSDSDTFNSSACGGMDCNDTNPSIYPGAPEICGNAIDEDCSGADVACHRSDADQDGCVSDAELSAFIGLWHVDSSNPTLRELMEAIGLWKRGCQT